MQASLILGGNGPVGGYLARLLQARGQRVACVADAAVTTPDALTALGIAGEIEAIDAADARRFVASGDVGTVFAVGSDDDILSAIAASARPPRFINIVDAAALRTSPAPRALANRVADLRRDHGLHAANAILHRHDSRLGGLDSMPAQVTLHAWRVARGLATGTLELPETGALDWGWTPEYVDAVARLAALPQPIDIEIASGHRLTTADFVRDAFGFFRTDPADHVRLLPGAATGDAIDPASTKAATGWSASTYGRDLVRALAEGAAERGAVAEGAAKRGAVAEGAAKRGAVSKGAAERGAASKGAAERGAV